MGIKEFLGEKRIIIDNALDRILPSEEEYPQRLHRAMRYSIFAGGKRIRPILLMLSGDAIADSPVDLIFPACAIELIHTYSLIHDDLPAMDDDELRRGKPTCHKVFGEATAVLAGDALLTLAFDILARAGPQDNADGWTTDRMFRIIRVIHEISSAAGSMGMVGGQATDMESEEIEISLPLLEYIHIHKTGLMIRSAVRSGAILAGADEARLDSLTRYGDAIGLAFQIADDILDIEGDAKSTGKNVGVDSKRGKVTYPALIGLKESKKRTEELMEKAISALSFFNSKADPLRKIARYIVERKG